MKTDWRQPSSSLEERLRKNLYPEAWSIVEPWRTFPWDRAGTFVRATVPHSSQALCIDVWGTIALSAEKVNLLNALMRRLGFPQSKTYKITFEWVDPQNKLNEIRRTQIDCLLEGDSINLLIECKFTEPSAGSCSRPLKDKEYGLTRCNGNYELQANPSKDALFDFFGLPSAEHRCSLSREGISYWDYIPVLFSFGNFQHMRPCPFRGSSYQIMRNLVLSRVLEERTGKRGAVLVCYAHHPSLGFSRAVREDGFIDRIQDTLLDRSRLHAISYQSLLRILGHTNPSASRELRALADWVEQKIQSAKDRKGLK